MKKTKKRRAAEICGWYGASAIMLGYGLVSFGWIESNGYLYQMLNLTGALGVLVLMIVDRIRQSIILNSFWAIIAFIALIRLATA